MQDVELALLGVWPPAATQKSVVCSDPHEGRGLSTELVVGLSFGFLRSANFVEGSPRMRVCGCFG